MAAIDVLLWLVLFGVPPQGGSDLIDYADAQIHLSHQQQAELTELRRRLAEKPFEEMSVSDLKSYFHESLDYVSPKDRRGWQEIRRRVQLGQTNHIPEIIHAILNNHRFPAPPSIHEFQPPLLFLDYSHNPIARGAEPARNLAQPHLADLSLSDPQSSTFWQRPKDIPAQNLHTGYGRASLPDYAGLIWEYAAPKTSFGRRPGFEASSGPISIKVKFFEVTSEPFAARIFHALGFHVEPTDYAPRLKLKYSRRYFREFHLRKELKIKMRLLGVPMHTIDLQTRHDPFAFITEAMLKDGRRIPGGELKAFLLRDPDKHHPEDDPANFKPDAEAQIDLLITAAANVQPQDDTARAIGPWGFDDLGHEHLRELRGAGLLAAWIGWDDSRFENTRLKLVGHELRHYFTDLGGGLGKCARLFSRRLESPHEFTPRFTRPPKFQGKGKMTIPFRITHFEPIQDTRAFHEMTIDDARWMARLIAQLTDHQIEQALAASGCDAALTRLYTEKLLSRRNHMLRDLGLLTARQP